MRLLKNYHYHKNLIACAIEFTKMVGADLHIRPSVPPRKTVIARRHPICE